MATEVGALFDEFVQTGLIEGDVTVVGAKFCTWDYKGKSRGGPVLALRMDFQDGEGQVHDDYLSSGDLKFFVPSSDGKMAVPVGTQTKLNVNTNAAAFLISLMNADTRGELTKRIKATNDISILVGLKVNIVRVDQPKRAGIIAADEETLAGQTKRAPQVVKVTKILAYPWETGAAPVAAAAPAAGQAAAPAAAAPVAAASAAGSAELEATAAGFLLAILAGGPLKKTAIAGKLFGHDDVKSMPAAERNAMLGIVVKPEFLGGATAQAMGIVFDPATGTVSLAG